MKNSRGSVNRFLEDAVHFKAFAGQLEAAIARYAPLTEEDVLSRQKRQIENLVFLENQFRKTLIHHRWGVGIYKDFMHHICETKRNILSARPSFRHRNDFFTREMIPIFKARAHRRLFRFSINYTFIQFVMAARDWHSPRHRNHNRKILELYKKITAQRTELVELNMPLAISRARIFYSWTPQSHMSYLDLIQTSAEGLMAGIDKFCLPFSRAFMGTCIGRMTGDFIEAYSETSLHFFPPDKKKLYRANKIRKRQTDGVDYDAIAAQINNDYPEKADQTTGAEIALLMSAASPISSSIKVRTSDDDDSGQTIIDTCSADESTRPDVRYEQAEAQSALHVAIAQLPMLEQKFLRLKGISL